MHSRVYAVWTQSEDLSVFLAFTRNGLRLEGHTPETVTTLMPKPTGYGTRPHPLTFHIHNRITLLVLYTIQWVAPQCMYVSTRYGLKDKAVCRRLHVAHDDYIPPLVSPLPPPPRPPYA